MHIAPIATACATAVLLACNVPPAPELPPLIAPADLLPEDEPVYMHAQFDKFKMAWFADFDRRYVDTYQVEFEYSRLSVHIQRWHEEVGHPKRWTDAEMQNAQYARTPEAEHYRGARKRAVAIGLLAMSLWWRNPGVGRPTAADMDKCVPVIHHQGLPARWPDPVPGAHGPHGHGRRPRAIPGPVAQSPSPRGGTTCPGKWTFCISLAASLLVASQTSCHDRDVANYDRLMAQGQTRRAIMTPLVGAGAFVFANDSTGVGVADDVLLPFLALGAVASVLATQPPASGRALSSAYTEVQDTAKAVSDTIRDIQNHGVSQAQGIDRAQNQSSALPRTRQYCINLYVDCKDNAARGFDARRCQACMDRCTGNKNQWPKDDGCNYRRTSTRNWLKRPLVIF